jgi:uncharacterized membrane protein (DUF485 family)
MRGIGRLPSWLRGQGGFKSARFLTSELFESDALSEWSSRMNVKDASQIRREPLFQELVDRRTRFAWVLSAAMLVIYFGFIAIIAFAPKLLATPIGTGVTTVGIPVGVFVIVSAFALTGIYIKRANSVFDPLTRKIIEKVK